MVCYWWGTGHGLTHGQMLSSLLNCDWMNTNKIILQDEHFFLNRNWVIWFFKKILICNIYSVEKINIWSQHVVLHVKVMTKNTSLLPFFISQSVPILLLLLLSHFSHVRLCATPQTVAHQAPPSLGFSRQEHWSELPFPSPMYESEKWKWSHSVMSNS